MASHSGVNMLCCSNVFFHETALAFYIHCHSSTSPVIRTDHLKDKFNGAVIYDQYFCSFAVSQKLDEYYGRGCRRVRYYVHCHCSSPGSLQCMSATAVLISTLEKTNLKIYDENCIPVPKLCCDSWNCIPMRFMGGYKSDGGIHAFVFLLGINVDPDKMIWPLGASYVCHRIHDTLNMVVVSCNCDKKEVCCVRRVGENFNMMRLFVCCSYDRADYGMGSNLLFRNL